MKTAVIIAGGLGTRLYPLTKEIPKALLPINGRPLIQHSLEIVKGAGATTIYVAVGYLADRVQRFLGDGSRFGVTIKYIEEKTPLGTGGWMKMIDPNDFDDDFMVVNGDDLSDVDFAKIHQLHRETNAMMTISLHEIDDPRRYGVAELDGNRIIKFVEKPATIEEAPSKWVSNGYYIFTPEVFSLLPEHEKFMIEYDISPAIAAQNKLFGFFNENIWLTTNDFEQWEQVRTAWKGPKS